MSKSLYTNQQPDRPAEMASVQSMAKKLPTNQDIEKKNEEVTNQPSKIADTVIDEPKINTENTLINMISSQLEEDDDTYKKPKPKLEQVIDSVSAPEMKKADEKPTKDNQSQYSNPAIMACMRNAQEIEEQEKEEQKGQSLLESHFEKTLGRYV